MGLDPKYMAQQVADIEETLGTKKFWRPKEGKYRLRLIPGWKDSKTYFVDLAQHYRVGPQGKVVTCARLTSTLAKKNAKCVVCDYVSEMQQSEDKDDQIAANRMRANHRYYMNVFVRDNEGGSVKIWAAPKQCWEAIEIIRKNESGDFGDILDPYKGCDLVLIRKGDGLNTKYSVQVVSKEKPMLASSKAIDKALDRAPDLTKLIDNPNQKALASLLEGEEADQFSTDEDEEKEEAEETDESEEEETEDTTEEEEPEEEEDEEEKKPKKAKKPSKPEPPKKKGKAVEDDDDEEEEEEDAEEEDEDSDEEEAEEEEESDDEEEEDDDEGEEEEGEVEDDDEKEPPKPPKKAPKPEKKAAKSDEKSDAKSLLKNLKKKVGKG